MLRLVLFLVFNLSAALVAFAQTECPAIDKVPDVNCDGSLIISVTGDSLVSGFGDTVNHDKGGYVKRLKARLKHASVNNFGKQGMFSKDLISLVSKAFKRPLNTMGQTFSVSDIIVIDVGRNDRWFFGEPIATYRNIKRAANSIRQQVLAKSGYTPYVVIAQLMLPNRGAQAPWVSELNKYIRAGHSKTAPADLRFDLVSKRLLGSDRIHPTPKGYDALAGVLYQYLTKTVQKNLIKSQ